MRTASGVRGLAFAVALVVCGGASATSLMHMTVEKMAGAARLIVRARCLANATRWDAGDIWTFTTFETTEVWKGKAEERFTVRLLGGSVGNLTSRVAGVPRFQPGEDVVLFLETTKRGDYSIVSWVQGTFRIRPNRRGGKSVAQDTADFATFDPATRRFEANGIRNMLLEALQAQVKSATRNQAGRKP